MLRMRKNFKDEKNLEKNVEKTYMKTPLNESSNQRYLIL